MEHGIWYCDIQIKVNEFPLVRKRLITVAGVMYQHHLASFDNHHRLDGVVVWRDPKRLDATILPGLSLLMLKATSAGAAAGVEELSSRWRWWLFFIALCVRLDAGCVYDMVPYG